MITYHHLAVTLRTLLFPLFQYVADALRYFETPGKTNEVELSFTEDLDELIDELFSAFPRSYSPDIGCDALISSPFSRVDEMLFLISDCAFHLREDRALKVDIPPKRTITVEAFLLTEDNCFQDTDEVLRRLYSVATFLLSQMEYIDLNSVNGQYNKSVIETVIGAINPIVREVLLTYVGGNIDRP